MDCCQEISVSTYFENQSTLTHAWSAITSARTVLFGHSFRGVLYDPVITQWMKTWTLSSKANSIKFNTCIYNKEYDTRFLNQIFASLFSLLALNAWMVFVGSANGTGHFYTLSPKMRFWARLQRPHAAIVSLLSASTVLYRFANCWVTIVEIIKFLREQPAT